MRTTRHSLFGGRGCGCTASGSGRLPLHHSSSDIDDWPSDTDGTGRGEGGRGIITPTGYRFTLPALGDVTSLHGLQKTKEQKNRVEPGSRDTTPTLAADDEDLLPWNSRKPRTVRVDQSCRILAAVLHCMQAEEYSYMRAFFFFNASDRLFSSVSKHAQQDHFILCSRKEYYQVVLGVC